MDVLAIIWIVVYAALVVFAVWILWSLVRSAVRRALRDHQYWLESRGGNPPAPDAK
jgi:hypothetical protein